MDPANEPNFYRIANRFPLDEGGSVGEAPAISTGAERAVPPTRMEMTVAFLCSQEKDREGLDVSLLDLLKQQNRDEQEFNSLAKIVEGFCQSKCA